MSIKSVGLADCVEGREEGGRKEGDRDSGCEVNSKKKEMRREFLF